MNTMPQSVKPGRFTATLSKNNRVVLNANWCKHNNIHVGDHIEMMYGNDENDIPCVFIRPIPGES